MEIVKLKSQRKCIFFLLFYCLEGLLFLRCRPAFLIEETYLTSNPNIEFEEIQFLKPGSRAQLSRSEQVSIEKEITSLLDHKKKQKIKMKLFFHVYWDDYISGYYKEEDSFLYINTRDKKFPKLKIYWPGLVLGLWIFYGVFPIVPRAGKIGIYLDATVLVEKRSYQFSVDAFDYYSSFYYGIYRTKNIEEVFQKVYHTTLEKLTENIKEAVNEQIQASEKNF